MNELFDAIYDGDHAALGAMLDADPARADAVMVETGETALMAACAIGDLRAVQVLLAAGAATDPRDDAGETALHIAAFAAPDPVVFALIEAGAALDVRCDFGKTPLMDAAQEGRAEVVARLLKAGADPRATDEEGRTALHWAIIADTDAWPVVRLLQQAGLRLDARTAAGLSGYDYLDTLDRPAIRAGLAAGG
ncbi:ankyrin repeat protein [Rhodovulum iodosum]|uniref:Ankyrin repeat protein n=1 Tax=Rhodovulum iodosum TaxID=68291 RepID=A0ABV3XXS3_9RHOB|nr:ankyrin repeat domain-containing protein [Rhodovulum robiginosum]RSK35142.1 ankyrin repeat domain-containing protein [Rhodovulum robiginosum]